MGKSGAATQLKRKETNTLETTSDLSRDGIVEISSGLRQLLADVFALYVKTKNFHWHMSGRHFRDYHLLLDEHSEQVFAMTDDIAERARKIGGASLHQRYLTTPTFARQQRRIGHSEGDVGRALFRQPAADTIPAFHA
jgi:starvation-inducible DNA-binding protein